MVDGPVRASPTLAAIKRGMSGKTRFFTLVAILVFTTLISAGVGIVVLYRAALTEERDGL